MNKLRLAENLIQYEMSFDRKITYLLDINDLPWAFECSTNHGDPDIINKVILKMLKHNEPCDVIEMAYQSRDTG